MKTTIIQALIALFIILGLSACGGSSPSANPATTKLKPIVRSFYIHIDKQGEKFIPVNISDVRENGHTSTLLVSTNGQVYLNGYTTGKEVNCNKYRHSHSQPSVYCKYDTPFFSNVVGIRFKPYGAIVLDEDNIYDYLDDYNLYDDINDYNELNVVINNGLKELDSYVDTVERKYVTKKADVTVIINDESGFYDNSINFEKHVYITHNRLPKATYNPDPYIIGTSKTFFSLEKEKFKKAFPALKQEFLTKINQLSSYVMMHISAPYSREFTYKINNPKKAYFNKQNKIIVTITGKNIKLNYPILAITDKILSVSEGPNNTVRFQNNSNDYISIKSISYYLNRDIFIDTDFDKKSILEIPPQSYIDLSKRIAERRFKSQLFLNGVTKKELKRKKINYGLAVKYISSRSNKIRTLYKTTDATIYSLIK